MQDRIPKYYHLTGSDRSYVFRHDLLARDGQFPLHQHPEWELAYVVRGSGCVRLGDETTPFVRGEVVLIPPYMPHGWLFDGSDCDDHDRAEDICLFFRRELPVGLAALMPEMERLGKLCRGQGTAYRLGGNVLGRMRRLLEELSGMDEPERFVGVLRVLLLLASTDELTSAGCSWPLRKTERKMQHIEAYVRLHYNRSISVDEAAGLVHMNRSSFCVFFRRMKGMPFTAWLNACRIDAACRLLDATDRPVAEIAYCVGFDSPAHFSRTFRKLRNLSPSRYRALRSGKTGLSTTESPVSDAI